MNAAGVAVRPYRGEDLAALVLLVRELQDHERTLFDRMKRGEDVGRWYVEGLLEQCAAAHGTILVADDGEGLAGYAVVLTDVVREDDDETEYRYALVADLMVTGRWRHKGLGTRLLQ